MSVESLWDVQRGIFSRLSATAGVTSLLANGASSILDQLPANTPLPYVVIGAGSAAPLDTQAVSGNDVTATIDVYSQGSGMQEVKTIMAAIYDALHHASFSVPNQTMVLCRCLSAEASLESDGVTRHGVQKFQVITEPL